MTTYELVRPSVETEGAKTEAVVVASVQANTLTQARRKLHRAVPNSANYIVRPRTQPTKDQK